MEEDCSTFPDFVDTLKECKANVDEALGQYVIRVRCWHEKFSSGIEKLLANEKTELQGLTPKMVLQEILGQKLQK